MPTALSRQQNSQLEAVGLHNKKLPGSVSLNASSKDAFEESDDDKMMHFGNPFQLPLTSSSFSSHQQQQQQEEEGARRYSMAVDRPSVYQNHQQNEAKHAHHLSAPASPSLLYKSLLLHHQNHQQQLYIQSPNYAFDSISVSSTESDSAVKNLLHNSPSRPSPLSTTAVSHNNNSNTTSTATTRSTAAARIEMDKSVLDSPTTATSITNSTTTSALSVTPSPTTHHTPFVGGVLSYAKWNIIDASSVDMSRASKLMMGALDPLDKTKFIIDTNRLPPSEIKRQEIFHELYVTEIEYARDLQLVLDVFVTGIKLRRLIPLTDMNTVFGNIDALAKLHLGLLMRMKELKRKGCGVAKGVGILFLKMVHRLKVYDIYCCNYPDALAYLDKQRYNHDLRMFLQHCTLLPGCRSLDLNSFLLKPVQRICKYPQLLQALLKETPKDHEDYASLKTATMYIKRLVDDVNDKKKFMEMRKDVTSLLSRISSTRCPLHSTDSPQRVIVLQGPLIKYSRAAILSSMANRYGVLFSDCFVWIKGLPTVVGNAAPSGKGYVSRVVFLKDMTGISDVKNDKHLFNFAISFRDGQSEISYSFGCKSDSDKQRWIKELYSNMKRALNEDAGVVPLRSSSLSAADIPPIFDTMLIKELPPSPTLSRAFSFCSSVSSLERPNSLDGVSCDYPTGDDVTIKSKYQRKRLSQYYRSPSSSPSSSVTASILQEEVDNEEEFVHTSSSSNSASAKELFKRVGGLVLRENMDRRGVDSATATANATDLDDIEETVTIIQEEEEDNPIPASKINNNRYSSNSESNTTSVTLVNGSHKSSSVLLDAVGGEGGFCDETSDSDYYSVCSTSNCPSTTHATPSLQQQLPITCSPVAATGLTAVSTAALSTPSSSTCSSSSSLPSNPNHDAFQTQSKSSSPPTLSSSEKVKHKSLEAEFALALDELFVDVLSGPSLAGSTLSKKSSRVSFREVLGVNNEGNSNSNNSNSSNLSSVKEVAASPLSSPEINMEPSKSVAVSEPISSSFKAMAPLAVVKSAPLSLPSSSSTSITTKQMLVTSSKSDLAPTPPRNHQSSMKPSDPIIKVSIPLSKSPHDPSNQLPLSPPILAEYPRNASLNAASEKVKVTTTTASPTRVIDKKHQPSVTRQPIPEVVISHSSSAPSSASMPVQSITALSKNISVTSLSPGGGGGGVLNSPSSPTTPTPQSVAAAAAAAMTLAGATGVSKTVLTTCSNIAKVGAPTTNSTTATTFLLPQTIVPVKRVEKPAPILVPSASHRHHFSSSSPPSVSKLKTKFEKISSSNSSLSITPPITATKTKTSSSSSSTSLISSSKSLSASCSKRFPSVSPTATLPTFSAVKLKFEAAAIPPALSRSSSSSSSITKKQVQAGKPVLETAVSKAITTTSASKINNNTPALRRRLETGAKERPKSLCGSSVLVKSSNKRIAAAVASAPSSARKSLDERRRNVDINSPLQQIAKPGSSALRSCVATAAAAPSNKNFATQYKKSTGFGAVWR